MKEIFLAFLSLIGVLGLIFVTFYAARKLNRRMLRVSGKNVRIIEREMLAQDKSVVVIKAGTKYMLLGVTAQHIDKLCDFGEEDIRLFEEDTVAETNATGTFLDNLKKATAEHPYIKPFVKNKERKDDEKNG